MMANRTRLLCEVASMTMLLTVWEMAGRLGWVDTRFVGQPSLVWAAAGQMVRQTPFLEAVQWSASELLLGLALATLGGISLGIVAGSSTLAAEIFDPLLMGVNAIPREALIPLIVIWFGIGIWAKALVVFLGAVIPIAVNTAAGMTSVETSWITAARSFGARKHSIVLHILLPNSVPHLVAGVKLGIGRAIVGMIAAEMFVAFAGIGKLMVFSAEAVKPNELLFLTTVVAVVGIGAVKALELVERRIAPWRHELIG